jgi:transcriptional regulator with XRE-family HTH domain
MAESRGYSSRLIETNKNAPATHPGVTLGRLCIAQDIPVADVAQFFDVSRMTIYKWFKGTEMPRKKQIEKIEDVVAKLKLKSGAGK